MNNSSSVEDIFPIPCLPLNKFEQCGELKAFVLFSTRADFLFMLLMERGGSFSLCSLKVFRSMDLQWRAREDENWGEKRNSRSERCDIDMMAEISGSPKISSLDQENLQLTCPTLLTVGIGTKNAWFRLNQQILPYMSFLETHVLTSIIAVNRVLHGKGCTRILPLEFILAGVYFILEFVKRCGFRFECFWIR